MATQYANGKIVTNGLVFCLDAADRNSYVSGSNLTYSLVNNFSGSFTNGTTYSPNNGGTFLFDGINDYITVSTPQLLNPGTESFAVDYWCRITGSHPATSGSVAIEARGTGLHGFLAIAYYPTAKMSLFVNGNQDAGQNTYLSTSSPVERGVWIHQAMTVDRSTQQITFYYNGLQTGNKVTITDTASIDPGSSYRYWVGGDLGGTEMNGEIAISRQYNRTLTADEVLQNYNAQKSRFGL